VTMAAVVRYLDYVRMISRNTRNANSYKCGSRTLARFDSPPNLASDPRSDPLKYYTTEQAANCVGVDWATVWRWMISRPPKFSKPTEKTATGYVWTEQDVKRLRLYCKQISAGKYSGSRGTNSGKAVRRAVTLNLRTT
jgi:hypothetical protein